MELSDTLCYREKLYESQFCKLTFSDFVTIHGYLRAFYRNFLLCKSTTVLPPWSKLVIFYVKNLPEQDLDEIAGQLENTLSKKYEWSKAGLDHIAASPARLPVNGQTVLIRVYIYSKTQRSENISENISKKIKELKMDLADGKMSSLSLAKVGNVNITQVVGCKDPQCLSSAFSMLSGIFLKRFIFNFKGFELIMIVHFNSGKLYRCTYDAQRVIHTVMQLTFFILLVASRKEMLCN